MLIAVTGGIGAGKSVVCRVLRAMGYPVFDCDSEAKALMDADCDIKRRIAIEIDESAVCGGSIDRRRLAEIVFADAEKLEILNSIVHGAVRQRIAEWAQTLAGRLLFVETAILFQSGLNYLNGCSEVERSVPQSPERDYLVEFIRSSKRGIIKPYASGHREA